MMAWLATFVRARFPLPFWGAVAALLTLAAAPRTGQGGSEAPWTMARSFVACVSALLLLRIADDALDRERDAVRYPERPLVDPASLGPALRSMGLLILVIAVLVDHRVSLGMAALSLALIALHGLKGRVPWRTIRGLLPQLKYPGLVAVLGLEGSLLSPAAQHAAVVVVAIGAACYECATDEELRSRRFLERGAGVLILGASVALLHAGVQWYGVRVQPTP